MFSDIKKTGQKNSGKVKVNIEGDIPNILEFNGQVPSKEASKAAYELLYANLIRYQLTEKGYDYK